MISPGPPSPRPMNKHAARFSMPNTAIRTITCSAERSKPKQPAHRQSGAQAVFAESTWLTIRRFIPKTDRPAPLRHHVYRAGFDLVADLHGQRGRAHGKSVVPVRAYTVARLVIAADHHHIRLRPHGR